MQGRERTERVEAPEYLIVDQHGRSEVDATMNHPVTDREQLAIAEIVLEPSA
jgi:hypothetical protein